MLVRIANGKIVIRLLLQKKSDLGRFCLSRLFGRQLMLKILEHLLYMYIDS